MTIQDRLIEIEERAEKATPGPWEESAGGDVCTASKVLINEEIAEKYVKQIIELPLSDQGRLDRKFIAASRTDIPKLVKALRTALAALDHDKQALTEIERILNNETKEK